MNILLVCLIGFMYFHLRPEYDSADWCETSAVIAPGLLWQ